MYNTERFCCTETESALGSRFKSPLTQLVTKILKRSFHFLGESVELRIRKSVSLPLHRFAQTPGREEFSSESFHLNRLCDHERSTWWEHRPLKNRGRLRKRSSAGDQKFPVSKHRRATSNCALDFPSWQVVVLASSLENKWKIWSPTVTFDFSEVFNKIFGILR